MINRAISMFFIVLCLFAFAANGTANPQKEFTVEGKQVFAGGFRVGAPERVEIKHSSGQIEILYFHVGYIPIDPTAMVSTKVSGQAVLSYVRQIVDLDIFAYAENRIGDPLAIDEFTSPPGGNKETEDFYVEIALSPADKEVIRKNSSITLSLFFWDKGENAWITAATAQENGEITGYKQLDESTFSFYILKWPPKDRPIAVGG